MKANGGLPQQGRKNECGGDAIGDAGEAIGGVSTDGPNRPEAGVNDGHEEYGKFWEGTGFGDGAKQVSSSDSEDRFAEHGHGASGNVCRRKSAPSGGWARSLQSIVGRRG